MTAGLENVVFGAVSSQQNDTAKTDGTHTLYIFVHEQLKNMTDLSVSAARQKYHAYLRTHWMTAIAKYAQLLRC